MEAVYVGQNHGRGARTGAGPWVMADLENGLWGSDNRLGPSKEKAMVGPDNKTFDFVTAMVKGDSNNHWAIKGGDATSKDGLVVLYDGQRPCAGKVPECTSKANNSYSPMRKFGGIILGIGGDNSHGAVGTFYEGAITTGYSTDAADAELQANIAAAGYGR